MAGPERRAVTAAYVLGLIAVVQGVFLFLLVVFVAVRRGYDRHRRAAFVAGQAALAAPLRDWIVAGAHPEPVVRALAALPRGTAVGYVALLARQTIPLAQRDELALALRNEPWIEHALRQKDSRFWWRRLEAARALSIIGTARERAAVLALVRDEHPAVQIAAASALPRVADAATFGSVVDELDAMPKVVRQFLTGVLRQSAPIAAVALAQRISGGAEMPDLASWIDLASSLDDPRAVASVFEHVAHPSAAVRRAVARTMGHHAGPEAARALATLVQDSDWTVRAAAALSVGEVGAGATAPLVAPLVSDPVWRVRLHAALALAQLGERGRAALRAAREGDDRFARDMATLVSGLSDGAVLEMGGG
jgi:HEAT repeat protein